MKKYSRLLSVPRSSSQIKRDLYTYKTKPHFPCSPTMGSVTRKISRTPFPVPRQKIAHFFFFFRISAIPSVFKRVNGTWRSTILEKRNGFTVSRCVIVVRDRCEKSRGEFANEQVVGSWWYRSIEGGRNDPSTLWKETFLWSRSEERGKLAGRVAPGLGMRERRGRRKNRRGERGAHSPRGVQRLRDTLVDRVKNAKPFT